MKRRSEAIRTRAARTCCRRVALLGCIAALCAFGYPRAAHSCSCFPVGGPKAELEGSTAVFSGEVLSRSDLDVSERGYPAVHVYTFRVYRAWKGVEQETVEVTTSVFGTACGTSYEIGGEYLVYAGSGRVGGATFGEPQKIAEVGRRPRLVDSSCSRTQGLRGAEVTDLPALGEPTWVNRAHRISLLSQELWQASTKGDVEAIRRLVAAGHDVDGKPRYQGESALIAAADGGHVEAVRALLAAGARVDARHQGETALTAAIRHGHSEVARLLLAAGARADAGHHGETALTLAISYGHPEIARLLLAAGAAGDDPGRLRAPLIHAARAGSVEVVEMLLAAGAEVTPLALDTAAAAGHPGIVESLVDHLGTSVSDVPPSIALRAAARVGHSELVECLLAGGAVVGKAELEAAAGNDEILRLFTAKQPEREAFEVDTDMLLAALRAGDHASLERLLALDPEVDQSALDHALVFAAGTPRTGKPAVILLLRAGAEIDGTNSDGSTALMQALGREQHEVTELLLRLGADPNAGTSSDTSALMLAVRWGRSGTESQQRIGARMVELLIRAGADVDWTRAERRNLDSHPGTALVAAIVRRSVELVRMLLEAGADARRGGALCAAAQWGPVETLDLLLDAGATAADGECSPLHLAANSGGVEMVARLLALGSDVEVVDRRGMTPLHMAASRGNEAVVDLLLEHGADVSATWNDGLTPLHLAARNGSARSAGAVRALLAAGADVEATTRRGWTPLMVAVPSRYRDLDPRVLTLPGAADRAYPELQVIELLLAAGADPQAANADGQTALMLAEEAEATPVAQLLRNTARAAEAPDTE